jgi:hypothetical protein
MESLVANCRPQPAIPALLVLLLTLMFAGSLGGGPAADGGPTFATLAVIAGVLASCGLAVAAGFCSLFPPLAWIVVALAGAGIIARMPGATYGRAALVVGVIAAVVMTLVQLWRVRTGRFVPTIEEAAGPD